MKTETLVSSHSIQIGDAHVIRNSHQQPTLVSNAQSARQVKMKLKHAQGRFRIVTDGAKLNWAKVNATIANHVKLVRSLLDQPKAAKLSLHHLNLKSLLI